MLGSRFNAKTGDKSFKFATTIGGGQVDTAESPATMFTRTVKTPKVGMGVGIPNDIDPILEPRTVPHNPQLRLLKSQHVPTRVKNISRSVEFPSSINDSNEIKIHVNWNAKGSVDH